MDDPSTDAGTQAVAEMQHHIETIAAAMTSKGRPITPDGVVEVARVAVPHAQHVGITLLRADRPPTNAGSTDSAHPRARPTPIRAARRTLPGRSHRPTRGKNP